MALDVSNILRVNPLSIPAAGGPVQTTFEASTVQGQSRLRADYELGGGVPYRIVGTVSLERDVFSDPRPFEQPLTLEATGNTSGVAGVDIIARVREVGSTGAPVSSVGRVAIQMVPVATVAALAAAAGGTGGLGERLKAFRAARGFTQEEAAEQAGVGRSTISRIENGSEPSETTRERLEGLLGS